MVTKATYKPSSFSVATKNQHAKLIVGYLLRNTTTRQLWHGHLQIMCTPSSAIRQNDIYKGFPDSSLKHRNNYVCLVDISSSYLYELQRLLKHLIWCFLDLVSSHLGTFFSLNHLSNIFSHLEPNFLNCKFPSWNRCYMQTMRLSHEHGLGKPLVLNFM